MLFQGRDSYNIQVISFSNSYRVVVDPAVVLTDERTQKARCVSLVARPLSHRAERTAFSSEPKQEHLGQVEPSVVSTLKEASRRVGDRWCTQGL